jgi:hypothetical protein
MNKEQVRRLESLKDDIILHLEQAVEAMINDEKNYGCDWTFDDNSDCGYSAQLVLNKPVK